MVAAGLRNDGVEKVDAEFVGKAFADVFNDAPSLVDEGELQELLDKLIAEMQQKKLEELEKIDRALEEKKAEKNGVKQNSSEIKKKQQIAIQTPSGLNKVAAVAKKAEELHLLVQRFTY